MPPPAPSSPFVRRQPREAPTLALGTMNFGGRTDEVESERILSRAIERGIRVIDTANVYNAGASERIVGRVLARDPHAAVIATKAGLAPVDGRAEGLSRGAIVRAVEASRQRLARDRIDVYYLHAPDHVTPVGETLDALATLLRDGTIGGWGVSNFASWQVLELMTLAADRGMPAPLVSQVLYNALHRQLDVEYFAFARHVALHTTVYNPLAGGLLTGRHRFDAPPAAGSRFDTNAMYAPRYWTRTMFDRTAQLADVAREAGCSLVDLAYGWLAARPGVDSILVGPATVAQLDAAVDAMTRPMADDVVARVDALAREWSGTNTDYVR